MSLTQEQQAQVAEWVKGGASLSDVQKQIETEFDIRMTYMDVRFLVDDLELELIDPNAKSDDEAEPETPEQATDADAELMDDTSGGVSVDVDAITRPGAVVSGNATFANGKSLGWQIDQMGRLGLIPGEEEFQPEPEDIEAFQAALRDVLEKKGF